MFLKQSLEFIEEQYKTTGIEQADTMRHKRDVHRMEHVNEKIVLDIL